MLDKLIKVLFWAFRRLDRHTALKLANFIGFILYVSNYRKSVVEKNLQIAFPDKDSRWRDYIRRKTMENIGRVLVEFPRQQDYAATGQIKDIVVFEEGLEELLKEKNGAVITTAHISNWEIGGAGFAYYTRNVVSLAYRQKNLKINSIIENIRKSSGIGIFFHDQPLKDMVKLLNSGKFVSFFVDQNALRHRGIFVDFFGLKASTVDLPAKLAQKYKKPVYFVYSYYREHDKKYYIRARKLNYEIADNPDQTVRNIVQAYTKAVEEAVRHHPEQYLWVHKRWKTRENEEIEKIYD